MSYSLPGLQFNYSMYAAPAAWVLSMAPIWYAVGVSKSISPKAYDNTSPQDSWKNLDQEITEPKLRGRILRAVAANNNSHVNLPFFLASLAVANAAHVDTTNLHTCAITYLGFRTAYNLAYILIETESASWFRSICYWGGVFACLRLSLKAAEKWSALPW